MTAYTGARVRKHNGAEYLTGRVTYSADISLPGMVHLAVVRSPVAHARILSLDVTAALAAPAVLTVLSGADAAELAKPIPYLLDPAGLGGHSADVRCLATGKVTYVGQPVAAVVADTPADAAAAARLVDVGYEELAPVLDAEAAMAADAPVIYEDWGTNVMFAGAFGDDTSEEAIRSAPRMLEGELRIQRSTPSPIETRTYIADWKEREQQLTWYGTTQNPHPQRWVLATALGLAERQVRVVAPPAGGAFGLKMHGHPEEVLVSVLSRIVRRPVKWVESRSECLLAGGREQLHRFVVAYGEDGRVHALHDEMIADHGAMAAGAGWGMSFVGANSFPSGYDIQRCRIEYSIVVTSKPPSVGMKPFGKDAPVLVLERVMDLVAEATGLDPATVRERNWIRREQFPYTSSSGLVIDSGNYHGLLEQAADRIGYQRQRDKQQSARAEGRHLGIGLGFEMLPEIADVPGSFVTAYDSATIRVDPSGQVTVLTGVTSPGGGNDTAIAQIVADRIGVAPPEISVVQGDTSLCPFGTGNLSSRGLVVGGGAAALAADDVAVKLRRIAAAMLQTGPEEVELSEGFARSTGDGGRQLPLAAVAHGAYTLGYILAADLEAPLESTRVYKMPNVQQIPDEKGRLSTYTTFSNALHVSVVEVDAETGMVEILDHVCVHDCGTMINPLFVEGQLQGGVVMGIGAALSEEIRYDRRGAIRTDGFKRYLMPRALDIPHFDVGHQVTRSPFSSLGAKGAGESGFAAAQASIVNAVNDALRPLKVRLNTLPLTPPRVLAAIREAASAAEPVL
jgi:carbon-monoxide dehydrogenase large subunit